ncbi:penicillin acylase family protein [Halorubellus salinus]|uniref:penicillin acylase family protein n=1 Tax=Halorubellus salinus TaxID=755309 RepID=UPI001D07E234|nr:penicillin acylase family protein [Halorubellus salinus]
MVSETTRRALLSSVLGVGVGGMALTDARQFLADFAPLSGSTWNADARRVDREVDSPYGDATVRYDDHGVPHVSASDERAAYYAVGYVQASDRLFEMDLLRRVMRGELSAVFGEVAVDSDRFNRQMDFARAAEVTWDAAKDGPAAPASEAFVDGVNAYREDADRPVEFELLDYDADPWTPVDSILAQKQISWGLTGSFATLRRAAVADAFDRETAETLYPLPDADNHDSPILRPGDREPNPPGGESATVSGRASATSRSRRPTGAGTGKRVDPDLVSWLEGFESEDGVGSNSWVVHGEYTASGQPVVANDPHLDLRVPPVWYEQHVVVDGERDVRGVTFPGVPFVIIGRSDTGAWGFTNAGYDVIDFYTYETRNGGSEYRYGDEFREFQTREETIPVADGEDETVEVTKSVHGAVLSRRSDGDALSGTDGRVGVQWTGLSAARTIESIYDIGRSAGVDDVLDALPKFDEPTQNFVYADRDGRTLYYTTGTVPVRRTDGDPVAATRPFDGSAREGEWRGFEPYGETDWAAADTIPFEEMPHSVDPGYLATANQRVTDDPPAHLSEGYASPFRGARIYERLDERAGSGEAMTPAFLRDVQLDAVDRRVDHLRPLLEDARGEVSGAVREELDAVLAWDGEMTTARREPLVFAFWARELGERVFERRFEDADLDVGTPNDWVLGNLPEDSEWFVPADGSDPDRGAVAAAALADALDAIDEAGHETYGDYNRTALTHPFEREFLNYPAYPTDGSPTAVNNFRRESMVGSSWRQVVPVGDDGSDAMAVLPGGNDGDPLSANYADQLDDWAAGRFREFGLDAPDGVDVRFTGDDGDAGDSGGDGE